MIDEARDIQERNRSTGLPNATTITTFNNGILTERPISNDRTLTNNNQDETIVPEHQKQPFINTNTNRQDTETDTFQSSSCNTMIELSSESSDTMIINENGTETENDADSQQDTLKVDFFIRISTKCHLRSRSYAVYMNIEQEEDKLLVHICRHGNRCCFREIHL